MKTLNTNWKLIALGTFAVMVTIWAGSRMEAKTGQDYTAQSARVSPQVREAAITTLGPIGLTRGQTLRIGLLRGDVNGRPTEVDVFDCGGNTLMHATVGSGGSAICTSHDLNADQLPQGEFDNSGRAEVSVRVKSEGGIWRLGSLQVFDNATGKTTATWYATKPIGDGNGVTT